MPPPTPAFALTLALPHCPIRPAVAPLRPTAPHASLPSPPPPPASAPVVIVPGKFDALHIGHRHLAELAARHGAPTLLSFSGMAAELRWAPRAPITAPADRARVLRQWRQHVQAPVRAAVLPFPSVRHLPPDAFVELLAARFGAAAVVCGPDWRFGRRAAGDVAALRRCAAPHRMAVHVADPVALRGRPVSSTRVREALAAGDVALVAALLGRLHRAVGVVLNVDARGTLCAGAFVNHMPRPGLYDALVRVVGRSAPTRRAVQVERRDDGEYLVRMYDCDDVYCAECDMYIDFVDRLV